MDSKHFKLKLIEDALLDLGYNEVVDLLSCHLEREGKDKKVVELEPKGENTTKEFIEWFYNELRNGNYESVLDKFFKDVSGQTKEEEAKDHRMLETGAHRNVLGALNVEKGEDKSIVRLGIILVEYIIKRSQFLEDLVFFGHMTDSKEVDAKRNDEGRPEHSLNTESFIERLKTDISPLLDEIESLLHNLKVNLNTLPMLSNKDFASNISREKESALLLSLLMKLTIPNKNFGILLDQKVTFSDLEVSGLQYLEIIHSIRKILVDDHLSLIFKPSYLHKELKTLRSKQAKISLDTIISYANKYQEFSSLFYLPPRLEGETSFFRDLISEDLEGRFPCKLIKTLGHHQDEVWIAKFSPLGKYLATGSSDGRLIIYDVTNNFSVLTVFFSESEKQGSKAVIYCCWDYKEEYLISCYLDTMIRVWSVKDVVREKSSVPGSMDIDEESSINSTYLNASFSLGENIRTWACEFLPPSSSLEASPQFIAGSPDKALKAFNIDGTELYDFYDDFDNNGMLDHEEDENTKDDDAKSSNSVSGRDNINKVKEFQHQFNRVNDLVVTPDGKFLITTNDDQQVHFFVLPNFFDPTSITKKIATINLGSRLTSCCLSASGKNLLLNLTSDELQIWDIAPIWKYEAPLLSKKLVGHRQGKIVLRSCFGYLSQSKEKLVLSGSVDGFIYIWKLETGQLITRVKGHSGLCNSVDWNRFYLPKDDEQDFGLYWCSVGDDKKVHIWGPP